MRNLAFAALALLATPLFGACSGADASDLLGQNRDGGPSDWDGATPPETDGAPGAPGSDGSIPDGGPGCDPSRCGIAVPAGFRPVTFAPDRATSCDAGWTTTDRVMSPVLKDPLACTCSCNVTSNPDCSTGSIDRYDGTSSLACTTAATTLTAAGTACTSISLGITLANSYYSADAPPATGGACTFNLTTDASKVSAANVRVCEPPTGCAGAVCASSGNVCVAQDGNVACPSSFPSKYLVGQSPNVQCGSCGSCTPSAECKGTLSMFTNGLCTLGEQDFPVDGTCNFVAKNTSPYVGFKYNGVLKGSATCGPTPTPTATPTLDVPTTVCCKS